MIGPLTGEIREVSQAGAALKNTRDAARQVWRDAVFRALDARSLQRLDTELRIFAGSLMELDALLTQALSLVE